MTDVSKRDALTDARAQGGLVAQEGFDYQLWDGLNRLPAWLRNPGFEGLIFEGLEDLEARFFAPHAPRLHLLERYQAKSGTLTRSELLKVFESFGEFDAKFGQVARVHVLVTPALPPNLMWLARDPGRVSRARPFYAPFSDIQRVSDEKLRSDLVEEFGDQLGRFCADGIEVSLRSFPDRSHAVAAFGAALGSVFPHLEFSGRRQESAFAALSELARRSIGSFLSRSNLCDVVEAELQCALTDRSTLSVHVLSDRNASREDAIEIDATAFGGADGTFPDEEAWSTKLVKPLDVVSRWIRKQTLPHRVRFSGSYRLSTAFSLGWSFRSAIGFEIDISTRSGTWSTDDRPTATIDFPWRFLRATKLQNGRLIVAVGILRDPAADVADSQQLNANEQFSASLHQAITSGADAQAAASALKLAISSNATDLGAEQIDLFVAGPAAFAVALGHRWNAMPRTQLYEFVASQRRYVRTARLG